jgi:glucose/arabinose dehydrogenase
MYFIKQIVVFFLVASFLNANENFKVEKLLDGLNTPWGISFLDENRLIITEKQGSILMYDLINKKLQNISHNLNILVKGQGGLLDVQISPNYKIDKWIYFTYVKDIKGGVTTLVRGELKNNQIINTQELLETKSNTGTGYHFGSRITFDEDGYLYFTVGDRGKRPEAQKLSNHIGSVIRLHLDGSVPKDNPFVNRYGLDEIYSYGHRNPQGIFYDKLSKRIFSIEHGPRGGDEINIIKAGANYGWPVVSYGKEYWNDNMVGVATQKKGMEQPIKYFVPSIAPSSLMVYSGKLFKSWRGDIFSGALKLKHLNKITFKNNQVIKEERLLKSLNERIRNVIESPKGEIFVSTDRGNIYKLTK